MSSQEDFVEENDEIQEVFIGDYCMTLPKPFKKDKEWLDYFMSLNNIKYRVVDEDKCNYNYGQYLMIKNISHLFYYMGDFSCNEDKKIFKLWDQNESIIKKRD